MKPTVSVVMAAKNYARFIGQAVRSVFAQTFADWELVIIDDGSTDDTSVMVKPFLGDARVRCVRSDRLGQPRAKNLGMRLSRGEFVAYLDADDAWEPTKLAKQLDVMRERPEVGVCHTGRLLMDETGRVTSRDHEGAESPAPSRSRLVELFLNNSVCFSSVMVRRAVFDQVGGFDPEFDLAIDYDLWLRVARHWQFACVPEPLVLYRTGHGNLSKKLSDRVATAVSIMTRHAFRRGLKDELPAGTVAEGFASTCNTLGYVMRPSEPLTAVRWYARGLTWGGRRKESLKGIAAAALRWVSGKREKGSAENASCNV
jgi:glycosyltransferase involved in cell wall biosynthesis